MLTLTTDQMKRAEALTNRAGLTYLEMMLNAGQKSYEYISTQFGKKNECLILCGNGNNAGDGFVIAKKLVEIGSKVTLVMCSGEISSKTAQEAYSFLHGTDIETLNVSADYAEIIQKIQNSQVIIDAVFGTGFKGELSAEISDIIKSANNSSAHKISLDIPTGINADTGENNGDYFCPNVTLVFGALKLAHTLDDIKKIFGKIVLCDIGIPNDIAFIVKNEITLISEELCKFIIPKRHQHTHKGNYGKFLNIAGSADMCGAAIMSTLAGMRVGAGLTTLATTRFVASIVAPSIMEATTFSLTANESGTMSSENIETIAEQLGKATACLVGCGMNSNESTKQIVKYIVENADCDIVLDADALNVISEDLTVLNNLSTSVIITPHVAEMARLTSLSVEQVQKNIMETAKTFAIEHGVIVVLKTNRTIIAVPNGDIFQNTTGNAGLAKGGSGDVLAGMIAGFLAQGMSASDACVCGVYLHGLAGDSLSQRMSQYSMLARDVIEEIPIVLKKLDR